MGLNGFYPWLRKKGDYHPKSRIPKHVSLPQTAKIRVDVPTFFSTIRATYTRHAQDKTKTHEALFSHLKRYGDPLQMVFYIDGGAAIEKKETHSEREEKRVKSAMNAQNAITLLADRVKTGQTPTKQLFKDVEKGLRGAFKWTFQDREDFVVFLQNRHLDARLCLTEADIAIAADCQPQDVVLSQDSDFMAYDSVMVLWRPIRNRDGIKILEYNKAEVLSKTGLSSTKLTALACVSHNDYNKNIPTLGIVTNYSIIKDLPDADVPSLVKEYLTSPLVVCSNHFHADFTASLLVFTTMSQEVAAASPSSSPSSCPSYDLLSQEYRMVKGQYDNLKTQKRQGCMSNRSDTKPNRQGKLKEFRRHRVIDRPANQPGVSQQVHRPRYAFKVRPEAQQHEPPSICKQYQRKPYTAKQEARYQKLLAEAIRTETARKQQRETRRLARQKELAKKPPPKVEDMSKMQMVKAMEYEHPLVSLVVGTVNANSKRAAAAAAAATDTNQPLSIEQQQQEVSACIAETVEQVRMTKRHVQEFLGAFMERAFEHGLTGEDRTILSYLCPAVESKILVVSPSNSSNSTRTSSINTSSVLDADGEGGCDSEVDDDDENGGSDDTDTEPSAMDVPFIAFYQILLAFFYSRKLKSKTVAEKKVGQLLVRAAALGISLPPIPPRTNSYPTNELLRSTTKQLYRSIKIMYRNGSIALEKKLNPQTEDQHTIERPRIDPKLPAVENYLLLNIASGRERCIAPLSPLVARYVGFSERDLLVLFWKWPTLKANIQRMVVKDGFFRDPTIVPTQADAVDWLAKTTPGRLLTTFTSDVGLAADKDSKGFRKSTTVMDKDSLRQHIGCLRDAAFNPKDWSTKGYILRGSIRTDGRLLQLLAFKMKELNAVRYRRVAEDKLPNFLTTTTGGTNSYLTEARNVSRTTADVESLLGADISQVTVLSLDLGVSCIVGASVSLPAGQTPATLKLPPDKGSDTKKKKTRRSRRKPGDRKRRREKKKARKLAKQPPTTQHFDLVVMRKAVSQPTDSFSHWLEGKKGNTIGASTGRTIQDIESSLPALKGELSSFRAFVAARQASEDDLDKFYNKTNFWKHRWDSKLCRQEEFYKVADGLLKMVGGSVGRPRMPHQVVVIAIGLAKFASVRGPPGLNGTFQAFFVNLARSLGYVVLGINEYYTSKRCPSCHEFVCATTDWRTLYCRTCRRFRQRDVMASENMNNAIKDHLIYHERSLYLQPQRQDGSYPWITGSSGYLSGCGSGGTVALTNPSMVAEADFGRKRRTSSTDDPSTDKKTRV